MDKNKKKLLSYLITASVLALGASQIGASIHEAREEKQAIEEMEEKEREFVAKLGEELERKKEITEQLNSISGVTCCAGSEYLSGSCRIENGRIVEEDFIYMLELLQNLNQYHPNIKILQISNIKLSNYSEETKKLFATTINSMKDVTLLSLVNMQLEDISFLENAQFKDTCTGLNLRNNEISNIDLISNFTQLETLYLSGNCIDNINSLENLSKLETLDISQNNITDISTVLELPNLLNFECSLNYLTQEDCIVINQLKEMGVNIDESSYRQYNAPKEKILKL